MDETSVKIQVGAKIKKYRQINKLTQFKLGEMIDINQRQVAQIELGKSFPSLPTLIKLANVFNCAVADLFEDEDSISDETLKLSLINTIKSASNEDCRRLYAVIKIFITI